MRSRSSGETMTCGAALVAVAIMSSYEKYGAGLGAATMTWRIPGHGAQICPQVGRYSASRMSRLLPE